MSEHARITDHAGNVYQWTDAERCMLLDTHTGEPLRFGPDRAAVGTMADAIAIAKRSPQAPPRYVIVRLSCIAPFLVNRTPL